MIRVLAVAHIVVAILLSPLTLAAGVLAPVFMIGPVWGAVLGVRMWKGRPNVLPIGLGAFLACFSFLTLILARPPARPAL